MEKKGFQRLLRDLERIMRDKHVKDIVERRIEEFESMRYSGKKDIFKELAFCILTANFSAERSIGIQGELGDEILRLSQEELSERLRKLGHRYPVTRARYIVEARKSLDRLSQALYSIKDELKLRDWIAKNIKGIGYKEASHFLRNIGFKNLSIIDFHIIDLLNRYGLIRKPRSLTRRRYLEIEGVLREVANRLGITLAELDLYLWYMETGRILK